MPRALFILIVAPWIWAGCAVQPEGPPPSVAGESAEQAAEISTEVACAYAERCGDISVTCADCEGDGCGGCFAEHFEIGYAVCSEELGDELAAGFACETLTADEEAAVDACLQALGEHPCPSVEQAEAWANGGGGDNPTNPPAGCEVLEDIRYRCTD